MADIVEFDPADTVGAGALGEPGERVFYIQAHKETEHLTVIVEKEQVALLASEAGRFLDQLDADFPDERASHTAPGEGSIREPVAPLFRARAIGIGFDLERSMVLLELREYGQEADDDVEEAEPVVPTADDDEVGWIARIYATRAQVRAMLSHGAEAVIAGRPVCHLCEQPIDPEGHACPRWN